MFVIQRPGMRPYRLPLIAAGLIMALLTTGPWLAVFLTCRVPMRLAARVSRPAEKRRETGRSQTT